MDRRGSIYNTYCFLLDFQNIGSNLDNNDINAFRAALNFINHFININYVVQILIFTGTLWNNPYFTT